MQNVDGPEEIPAERISRISKLTALAIKFDLLIREGVIANQAKIAQVGQVTEWELRDIVAEVEWVRQCPSMRIDESPCGEYRTSSR